METRLPGLQSPAASGADGAGRASVDRRLLDRRRGMDVCAGVRTSQTDVRLVAGLGAVHLVSLNIACLSGVLRVCTLFALTAILPSVAISFPCRDGPGRLALAPGQRTPAVDSSNSKSAIESWAPGLQHGPVAAIFRHDDTCIGRSGSGTMHSARTINRSTAPAEPIRRAESWTHSWRARSFHGSSPRQAGRLSRRYRWTPAPARRLAGFPNGAGLSRSSRET